jgi:hypothetical protein
MVIVCSCMVTQTIATKVIVTILHKYIITHMYSHLQLRTYHMYKMSILLCKLNADTLEMPTFVMLDFLINIIYLGI